MKIPDVAATKIAVSWPPIFAIYQSPRVRAPIFASFFDVYQVQRPKIKKTDHFFVTRGACSGNVVGAPRAEVPRAWGSG